MVNLEVLTDLEGVGDLELLKQADGAHEGCTSWSSREAISILFKAIVIRQTCVLRVPIQ